MKAQPAMARTALVAGATGLVGRELLTLLLRDRRYGAVHTLGRRAPPISHPKLHQHNVDFAHLGPLPEVNDVYIALGTTIKVAGSQQAFRALDFDAVLAVATAARAAGASRLGVVSAMGASAKSSVFYNRVKGEMEEALCRLGFDAVVLARPSLLDGDRQALAQPVRAGEGLALRVMRALAPLIPANYRVIRADRVARALQAAVADGKPGIRTLLSGDMLAGH